MVELEKINQSSARSKVLKSARVLKGKIYRTVVRPAMIYGSECWPVSKTNERRLNTAEMRILWTCGLMRCDKVRNEDIRTLMLTALMHLKSSEQLLRCFGYVLRRPPLHPTRQALEVEVSGKRPRGAPEKRRKDAIGKDMKEVGVTKDNARIAVYSAGESKWSTSRMRQTDSKKKQKKKTTSNSNYFDDDWSLLGYIHQIFPTLSILQPKQEDSE